MILNTPPWSIMNHQSPHIKEPDSTIPAPDKNSARIRLAPVQHSSGPSLIDPVIDPETVIDPESVKNKNKLTSEAVAAMGGVGGFYVEPFFCRIYIIQSAAFLCFRSIVLHYYRFIA